MLMEMIVTEMTMTEMRDPVEGPQKVQEITVLLFSLRIGPSTNFYLG